MCWYYLKSAWNQNYYIIIIINNLSVHFIIFFLFIALVIFNKKCFTSPYLTFPPPQNDSSTLLVTSDGARAELVMWGINTGINDRGKAKAHLHFIALTPVMRDYITLKHWKILGYYDNITLRTSQTNVLHEYDLTWWRTRSVIQAISLSLSLFRHAVVRARHP